ncbi:MAG: PQQ-binding-like beta-propeller repeat protein [Phycisphaerales bacterium]
MTHLTRRTISRLMFASAFSALVATTLCNTAAADDWPMWGRTPQRNMTTPAEKGLPSDFSPGEFIGASDQIDPSNARNVKWIAKLGSQSYGNPTVANGRVYIGTNNDAARDPKYKGDRSTLFCLDEQSGELIWQLNFPKLGTGKVSDWEFLGICSSPTIVGNRLYFVSNLCEVVAADANGMADGNDGPFTGEAALLANPGEPAIEISETDGDILWRFNMIDECGVFPHNITSSAILAVKDYIFTSTSNGVDYGHVETPAPFAPSMILLDREGNLIGEEGSGLSQRIFHCNWSSPAWLETGTLKLCIFGGPDGWVYGFSPQVEENEDGYMILKEAFRFDANPPEYRERDGKPIKYATRAGPSEVLATPVVHNGKIFVAIGQDPEHGEGAGNLVCIDPNGTGDITSTNEVWSYRLINRSISTVAITESGLLFTADFSGFIYCFDAGTGELKWKHDTMGHIWASPLVADGKVYIGNEDGYLTILKAGPELEVINEIDMMSPIYSSPIAANGVLYVGTHTHLFAIADMSAEPQNDAGNQTP